MGFADLPPREVSGAFQPGVVDKSINDSLFRPYTYIGTTMYCLQRIHEVMHVTYAHIRDCVKNEFYCLFSLALLHSPGSCFIFYFIFHMQPHARGPPSPFLYSVRRVTPYFTLHSNAHGSSSTRPSPSTLLWPTRVVWSSRCGEPPESRSRYQPVAPCGPLRCLG